MNVKIQDIVDSRKIEAMLDKTVFDEKKFFDIIEKEYDESDGEIRYWFTVSNDRKKDSNLNNEV